MGNRRDFLKSTGLLALASSGCAWRKRAPPGDVWLNDVHSKLNATRHRGLVEVDSLASLQAAVRRQAESGGCLSIGGGRHAMGGQQFGEGTVHLDTRAAHRVLGFDRERGVIEVEAGIQWPELIAEILERQAGEGVWGIAQKQTGADRLCIGGALSANAHGRGLKLRPMVGDVESFVLVDAQGHARTCSRGENSELFGLALGGYGLFGVIYSVRLRLAPRLKLERQVEIRTADGLAQAFEERVAAGYLYGDFQFDIDESSDGFLRRGVFACYRPVDSATPMPTDQGELSEADWNGLIRLAHADKAGAWQRYSEHYLATSGQLYWSDTHQLGYYPDDYHQALDRELHAAAPGSEMISELYVPRGELAGFLSAAAEVCRREGASVIYGTIRLIERDDETFLAWARERFACCVLNLHVEHSPAGIERAQRAFRALIDLAAERGGSFFLTYHRWALKRQVERCYPRMPEFLALKREYDPQERFQSEWYRHYRAMFRASS